MLGVIILVSFGFYKKKVPKSIFFLKTKTGSNRSVSVRFFMTKTSLARFFLVFFRFFFGLGLVRFGFFGFRFIKPNRTSQFFQNFNRFFSQFGFFSYFFFGFLNFSVFLLTPTRRVDLGLKTHAPELFLSKAHTS